MENKKQRPVPQDWDENEWGNQGDSESFNKSNYTYANEERYKSKSYRAKHKKAVGKAIKNNPELTEKKKAYMAERNKDPAWQKFYKENSARLAKDPDWQKAQKEGLLKKMSDPDVRAKLSEGVANSWNDPKRKQKTSDWHNEHRHTQEYKDRIKNIAQKNHKEVCSPYGNFESLKDFGKATGLVWHDKIKQKPHLFYYKDKGPSKPTYENVFYYKKQAYKSKRQILINNKKVNESDITVKKEPKREWELDVK